MPVRATRLPHVAEPARTRAPVDDVPIVDPAAIQQAYRVQRARRRGRLERQRARRLASVRFAVFLVLLLALAITLAVTVWHEVQRLFGL